MIADVCRGAALALLVLCGGALARAPENADPDLAPWFKTLTSSTGRFCCDRTDGHILHEADWREDADGIHVWTGGAWVNVSTEAVLQRTDNPTGSAVAFWLPSMPGDVRCFVRPSQT